MKRAAVTAAILVAGALLAFAGVAAPPKGAQDAPTVSSLRSMLEKELHWGMSHQEVTDVFNNVGGYFDREYAPQIGRLQPGVEMSQLEADRESRKANFMRAYAPFLDTPTGYDLTPIHSEYSYRNEEGVQPIFKDGKKRYFFYIRDKLTDFGDPFYGPVAFGTSARSSVLTDWPDGGFIGVHGTDEPQLLPGHVSHGCIRMPNSSILILARLMPVGTPLTVT